MADKAMVQFELDVYPKGHEKVGQKIDKDKDPDAYEKRKEVVRQYIWPMVDGKLWHKRTPAAPDDRTRGKWKPARKKKPSKKK
jgi:hypothetical protein